MNDELHRLWGTNLKVLRQARGLSQEALAHILDVSTSTVSRWEKGLMGPRDNHKVAIAEALDADVRTLFPLVRRSK